MKESQTALLRRPREHPFEASAVRASGIYAWWGVEALTWPDAFPAVSPKLPLYVGIAENENLAERIVGCHLSRTRGSALRRSLSALLIDELGLRTHMIPGSHRRPSKYGMEPAGEQVLTEWMLTNLRVSWLESESPGAVERFLIESTLPPLNDVYATGSPYRTSMRVLRAQVAASVRSQESA